MNARKIFVAAVAALAGVAALVGVAATAEGTDARASAEPLTAPVADLSFSGHTFLDSAPASSAAAGVAVPAQTVDITPPVSEQTHPTTDYAGTASTADDRVGTTRWRVVKNTGNCCENHTTVTPEGRLFDIGGSYINYTDDRGLTWKSVRPLAPLINGEGSITVAPNGDILATEWDAYTGDHLLAYKYNAVSGKWFTMENVLHHPVYDRPWISVVPGPFAIGLGADTVPYITFVQGGTGVKDPMLVSTDGLNYVEASSLIVDGLTDTPVSKWFPITADASFDWIQPIRRSPVTGLGAGYAHAPGRLLDPADRKWDEWRLPNGSLPPTNFQIDSAGRIHEVRALPGGQLEYRISKDAGRSWTSLVAPLPLGSGNLSDFKVNRAAGVGAIATRVGNQDWVYKFDVTGDTAKLLRRYRLGLGDTASVVGVTTNPRAPRMDFQTISIYADGRVAASFLDSTTLSTPPGTGMLGRITPIVAIELDTALPPLKPDLTVGSLDLTTVRSQGADEVTFHAQITNAGAGGAAGFAVRFIVDGVQLGADQIVSALASGGSATLSSATWNAKHRTNGDHTVQVLVDPAGAIAETNEANNAATKTFYVEGNKVRNGSFETDADGNGSPDSWSSSGSTAYESGGSEGERSVSAGPGGAWLSDPVAVEAGETYVASVSALGSGTLAIQQLAADGSVLASATQALLSTSAFSSTALPVTVLPGATQLRVVLAGGTAGLTRFDDVWLGSSS